MERIGHVLAVLAFIIGYIYVITEVSGTFWLLQTINAQIHNVSATNSLPQQIQGRGHFINQCLPEAQHMNFPKLLPGFLDHPLALE